MERTKFSQNKSKVCAFYSDTFQIPITKSKEQVKEVVIIEDLAMYSPSIFIILFDKKFYHISLKTQDILDNGELKGEDPQNFKLNRFNKSIQISYISQYQIHFLDIIKKEFDRNLFAIQIPSQRDRNLSDEQKTTLVSDGFFYEGFEEKNALVTCEVYGVTNLPSIGLENNLVYCNIYYQENKVEPFTFTFKAISKQVILCKLNNQNSFGVFENHRQFTNQSSSELIMHTYNVNKKKLEGYKKLILPVKEDSCVLSARYIDKAGYQIMIVGNEKNSPFINIYDLRDDKSQGTLRNNILLTRSFDQLMSRVLLTNEKYIFYEVVQDSGVYLEFLEYNTRCIRYKKKIQYQKNPFQKNKETNMDEDELAQLQNYQSDSMYITSVYAASDKTLVFLDDQDCIDKKGNKSYNLIINYHRYTQLQMLVFYYMQQKQLLDDYSQIHIYECIKMLFGCDQD